MRALLLALVLAAPEDPGEAVRRLLAAKPADRAAIVDVIVAAKPDPAAIAAAFETGRTYYPGAPAGWLERTVAAPDGKERPYLLHVPPKYDPAKRYRMVIDLHGGVSRPQALTHAGLEGMKFGWAGEAEKREWILAIPAGDAGATWWNANGAGMVLEVLRRTREIYPVDENAVFVTGFSDGGSGAFHLALTRATPFAGFIPLNGHPSVAGAGGTPVFLRNLLNRPVYAVNTAEDSLYPSAGMKPLFDAMAKLGAPVTWRDLPGFGHDWGYLPEERPAILAWMDGVRRNPAPKVCWWEGTQGAPRRIDWIDAVTVSGGSGKEPFPDANPDLVDSRIRLGVRLDEAFAGPGARITGIVKDSLAREMDLRDGDVLLSVDGKDLASAQALRGILGRKAPGDDLVLVLRRGADTLEKGVKIPAPKPRRAFDRDRPWGTLRAEAKGNRIEVTCLGIGSFEVRVSPRLVDMGKPVEVVVNGKTAFDGVVPLDLRWLLEKGAEDADRTAVWWARIPVTVAK